MERAAEMLATRMFTVREVANRVGYRQPAQFAKAFRRHCGVSPSDFRPAAARWAGRSRRARQRNQGARASLRVRVSRIVSASVAAVA